MPHRRRIEPEYALYPVQRRQRALARPCDGEPDAIAPGASSRSPPLWDRSRLDVLWATSPHGWIAPHPRRETSAGKFPPSHTAGTEPTTSGRRAAIDTASTEQRFVQVHHPHIGEP